MTCWRCGAVMDAMDAKCGSCGAPREKVRRGDMYRQQPTGASRPPVDEDGDGYAAAGSSRRASRQAAATGRPRRAGRSRPMEPYGSDDRDAPVEDVYYADEIFQPEMIMEAAGVAEVYTPAQEDVPRMVRRHTYKAILPETRGYDHVRWLRLCLIAIMCVIVLVAGIYFFLARTAPGQRWLAANGREASVEAYHEIGRMYMADGSISKAIWALEIAQGKDPNNLEVLIDLGKAYMGSNNRESAEIAYTRAIHHWPAYPEPYRLLADNMLEQGRNFEALQLIKLAIEETGDNDGHFDTMYTYLIPELPAVSRLGDKFEKEIDDLVLTSEPGTTIYYTTNGDDPMEKGKKYNGEALYLPEGTTKVRAVAEKEGMYSHEQAQTYVIIKPSPDMPKSNLAQGTYKSVKTISLRGGGKEEVDIYYTIDGTAPTVESMKFEEPITLRIGKTQLRAIAVNAEGKISNELVVVYKCEGKTMASMEEKDTIDKLKLFSTTRDAFESTYGATAEVRNDGEDLLGSYTKLMYPFGHAVFLDRGGDKEPVLVELSTNSTAFSGPRSTGIGSRMDDVIGAFRDEGGEENVKGDRILYTLTSGRIGMMTKLSETEYQVSYYCKQNNGQHVELTYHISNGLVDRMDWLQY